MTQRRSNVCSLHQYSIIHKTWQLTSAVILGRLHILDLADPLTRLRPPQLRLSVSLVWCGLVREHLFAARTMTCKSRTTRTSPVHAEGCTVMESAASRVVHHHNHAGPWICCNLIGGFLEFVLNLTRNHPSTDSPPLHSKITLSHLPCTERSKNGFWGSRNITKIIRDHQKMILRKIKIFDFFVFFSCFFYFFFR